jgi:anaerobic selenocysteine-containing dehydrogenase
MTGGALQGEDVDPQCVRHVLQPVRHPRPPRGRRRHQDRGEPQEPAGHGAPLPRGLAGIQLLYDLYRVNQPLKRGNPEKGIGVDPRWQPIGWDEALATIVDRLKQVRAEDPRKLLFYGTRRAAAGL